MSCLGSSLRDTSVCWPISDYDCAILVFPIPPPCFNLYFQPPHCKWFVFYKKSPWCCNLGEEGGGEGLFLHWHLLSSFSCFYASFHVILSQTCGYNFPVYTILWVLSQISLSFSLFKTWPDRDTRHSAHNLGLFLVGFLWLERRHPFFVSRKGQQL